MHSEWQRIKNKDFSDKDFISYKVVKKLKKKTV